MVAKWQSFRFSQYIVISVVSAGNQLHKLALPALQ